MTPAGIDEALAGLVEEQVDEVQVLARGALNGLFILFRLAAMHSLNNEAFAKPLGEMVRVLNVYLSRGSFVLRAAGDTFFVNNVMVRLDSTSFTSAEHLSRAFDRFGIGAVIAKGRAETEDLQALLRALQTAMAATSADERRAPLKDKRFGGIALRSEVGEVDALIELKREIQRLFAILVVARAEFAELGAADRFPPLKRLKRLVQNAVELIAEKPDLATALAQTFGGTAHAMFHPVDVTLLAVVIGRAMGLSRKALTGLGLAALLHDLGMDDRAEVAERKAVPESVEMLVRFKGLNEQTLLYTVVADELALYTGYAPGRGRWYHGDALPGLFTRIIAVAHLFERLVNADARVAASPHLAVLHCIQYAKKDGDPRTVKALLEALGPFPVGTVVALGDGSLATVIWRQPDPSRATMPVVRPLPGHSGAHPTEALIDLAAAGNGLRITAAVEPAELRISVPAEVLAS